MKLPKIWLQDYLDIDVNPHQFASDMTMSGSKVEEYFNAADEIKNVVIGKVESLEKHPDSDHLIITQINIGKEEKLQIVTGASNLTVGDIVPVCLDGAVLPGGKVIKSGKLRGILSQGMLCSLSELGFTKADFPYAIEEGIFVVQEPCNLGDNAADVLGINNVVTDFEITSNRVDCYSILGLVREAAATYNKKANIKTPVVKGSVDDIKNYIDIKVDDPALCPRYMVRGVKNVKIGPSPRWMRERLRLCGVRPINNIVDITNFVMLEYGQPLHAFDARFLDTKEILVRRAKDDESIVTLDGVERKLDSSILVITNGKVPVCVAGVMGGENSEIKEDTTTVIFECANFNGPCVRRGAKKLGMRTEASNLFEKGLPTYHIPTVLDRVCELVEQLGCGEVIGGYIDVDNSTTKQVDIKLDVNYTNSFLALNLTRDQMVEILRRLEFEVLDDNTIIVPPYRQDIEHNADIAEEIARIYGYNNIDTVISKSAATVIVKDPQKVLEGTVTDLLVSVGLNEIMTYTFISPKFYDKIDLSANDSRRNSVTILNPLGEDTSVMRTTSVPSMLSILARNYNNRNAAASLFEIAKVFIAGESKDVQPTEKKVVTIGSYGNTDFYDMKGNVCAILDNLKIDNYEFISGTDEPYLHPGRSAVITINGEAVGIIGQVHPKVADNFEIETECFIATLDMSALLQNYTNEVNYKPLPRFPAVTRDIAIICDEDLEVAAIEKIIKEEARKLYENCTLFDVYRGKQIPENKKSVAYSITLRAEDRTLVDADVEAVMKRINKRLINDLKCEQR